MSSAGATSARTTIGSAWLTLADGRRVTKTSVYTFLKAVAVGKIACRALPGCAPQYAADDCRRFAAEREADREGGGR